MKDTSDNSGSDQQKTLTAVEVEQLQALARECVRQGLPLPREVYSLPWRDRLDWSQFPSWARPIDPEMFCEVGHEG